MNVDPAQEEYQSSKAGQGEAAIDDLVLRLDDSLVALSLGLTASRRRHMHACMHACMHVCTPHDVT
jgi:hypothetical protein